MFAQILDLLAQGRGVQIFAKEVELSTQKAADMLNVSRPYHLRLRRRPVVDQPRRRLKIRSLRWTGRSRLSRGELQQPYEASILCPQPRQLGTATGISATQKSYLNRSRRPGDWRCAPARGAKARLRSG
jgi:hypothetical protein